MKSSPFREYQDGGLAEDSSAVRIHGAAKC